MIQGIEYRIVDEDNRFGILFSDGQYASLKGVRYSIPLMIRVIEGEIILTNDVRFQEDIGDLYVYFTEYFDTPGMFHLKKCLSL